MRIRLKHQVLAEALAKSSLTLNRWAQKMELRSGHLSELANGKRLYPTAKTRAKLLQGLGLEFDDLFELEERSRGGAAPAPEAMDPGALLGPGPGRSFSNTGSTEPVLRISRRRTPLPDFARALLDDLRTALRSLLKAPGFALTTLVVLSTGLGAAFALFGMTYATLFRTFAFPEESQLVTVRMLDGERGNAEMSTSYPDYLDFAEANREEIDLAAWDWEPYALAGGDRPLRAPAGRVTANFLRVSGLDLVQGRWFTDEEVAGDEQLLVIREAQWHSTFGGDPAILGRVVELDGEPATIIGIAPDALTLPDDVDMWLPLRTSQEPEMRGSHWLGVLGRLHTSSDEALAALNQTAAALEAEYPISNTGKRVFLRALREDRAGDVRGPFLSTLVLVGLLLVLVSANTSSLLFARATAREAEFGVRGALGATAGRVARQVLLEAALLCSVAFLAATVLGRLLMIGLLAGTPTERVPAWLDLSLDGVMIGFALVTTALVAVTASILAARRAAALHAGPLQQRLGASGSRRSLRLRNTLVVAQVVLTTVLVSTAAVSARSLFDLLRVEPGFESDGTLLVGLDLLALRSTPDDVPAQFERFLDRLEAVPGVTHVGAADHIALSTRSNHTGVTVENPRAGEYDARAQVIRVTPDYPQALGLVQLQGDSFAAEEGERREALVSESLALRWWPEGEALGQRFRFGRPEDVDVPWYHVIGVVGDVHQFGLDRARSPTIYITHDSRRMTRATWVIRSEGRDPESLVPDVRSAIASVDPNQPVYGVLPMTQHIGNSTWIQRFLATIFAALSILALLLAGAGLAGVVSYTVSLRQEEFGVRMALGATPQAVLQMFTRNGLQSGDAWPALRAAGRRRRERRARGGALRRASLRPSRAHPRDRDPLRRRRARQRRAGETRRAGRPARRAQRDLTPSASSAACSPPQGVRRRGSGAPRALGRSRSPGAARGDGRGPSPALLRARRSDRHAARSTGGGRRRRSCAPS